VDRVYHPVLTWKEAFLFPEAAARMLVDAKRSKNQPAVDVYPPGWTPKTAAQQSALESSADIQLFGGAAGSLKTETMLVDAARESNNPNLHAISASSLPR